MICSNCGAQLSDNIKFCPNCGEKILETPMQQTQDVNMLVTSVQAADEICQQIYKMGNKKTALEQRKQQLLKSFQPEMIILVAVGLFGLYSFFGLINSFFLIGRNVKEEGIFLAIIIFIGQIVIFIIAESVATLLGLFVYKKYKKSEENKRAKIAEVDAQIKQTDDDIDLFYAKNYDILQVLPPDYRYAMASNYILSILINCRADSIKEAVNLYETQLHQWRMENYQSQILNQQIQINKHLIGLDIAMLLMSLS